MKTKVYLRIGKDSNKKIKIDARLNPNIEPLKVAPGRYARSIPTVYMALELEIPDAAFNPPTISAYISIPIEKLGTAVEVVDPLRLLGE